MNFEYPSFEIIEQEYPCLKLSENLENYHNRAINYVYKHIELCGRTCYKSSDKITESSAEPFVTRMINSNHGAMLEHGTIYLTIPIEKYNSDKYFPKEASVETRNKLRGIHVNIGDEFAYVTLNLRHIISNDFQDDLIYMSPPLINHEKRYTVKFTANIQYYKDTTRHRVFSWAIESTRYCNYLKNRFGGSLSFITPPWLKGSKWYQKLIYKTTLQVIEWGYLLLVKSGWQPQQASNVLPQATKADVIMTGYASDFKHFFSLRADGATGQPHPQVKELALPLKKAFEEYGYIY